ncbi:MAG: DUF1284 domain-containing protein [Candidatus Pacearchaeota archaeon]|nr:DUF1284 domain-containing protein [Candidatus Pacearchaeota archaeon]
MMQDTNYKPLVNRLQSAKKIIFEGALVHLMGDAVAVLGPCILGLEPKNSETWWDTYFLNGYVPLQVLAGVIIGSGTVYANSTMRNQFTLRGHHVVDVLDCACEQDAELQARKREFMAERIGAKSGKKAEGVTRKVLDLLIHKPKEINLTLTTLPDTICEKCSRKEYKRANCSSEEVARVDSREISDAGFELGRPYNCAEIKELFLNNPNQPFLQRRMLYGFWYGVTVDDTRYICSITKKFKTQEIKKLADYPWDFYWNCCCCFSHKPRRWIENSHQWAIWGIEC